MRNLFLAFSIFLYAITCNAQSFLGATIGTDFALVRESHVPLEHKLWSVNENGYSAESLVLGLRGEQHLASIFSLVLNLSYTRKNVKAGDSSFDGIEGLKFNYFQNSIIGIWYPVEKWYIGAGPFLNYLSNVNDYDKGGNEGPFFYIRKNKKEYGGLLSTGMRFNNILLDLYFNKSFTPARKDSDDFKPINSFGISLSYLIRVRKNKRR